VTTSRGPFVTVCSGSRDVYSAWVRFSSASTRVVPDSKRDAHGMAVKVLGVAGDKILPEERDETTQDFVLANSPVFFVRSAADNAQFVKAFTQGRATSFFWSTDASVGR